MLYVVYGAEKDRARAKKDALIASCRKQRPDAEFFVIDSDNFSENTLQSLYSSQGLFERKHIVLIDRVLPKKKAKEIEDGENEVKETKDIIKETILGSLPGMANSESVFILFDETFDVKTLAQIKKNAKDIFIFGEKKEDKGFNNTTFLIVDSFCAKDKRGAWVNYQKAIRSGIMPEPIYGALFSGIKMMLLAKKTKNEEEAGAKSFPYNKAKNFAAKFTEDEINEILAGLNKIYHGIRSEGGELEIELEKFLLEK